MGRKLKTWVMMRNTEVSVKEEADAAMGNTLATALSTAHEKEYKKCCTYVRVKENIKSAPTCGMFTPYFKHLHDTGSGSIFNMGVFFCSTYPPPTLCLANTTHHGFIMTHHVFSLTRSSIFSISTLSNFLFSEILSLCTNPTATLEIWVLYFRLLYSQFCMYRVIL